MTVRDLILLLENMAPDLRVITLGPSQVDLVEHHESVNLLFAGDYFDAGEAVYIASTTPLPATV